MVERSPVVPSSPHSAAAPALECLDLFTMLNLAWAGQAVYVAAELQLADLVSHGPRTVDELAAASGVDAKRLAQVLQALSALDIFARDGGGRYRITPRAALLRTGSWLYSYALLWGEQLYPAGGQLLAMLRGPETGFEAAHGQPLYEHYRANPAAADRFIQFMADATAWQRRQLATCLDLSAHRTVVDVGGGRAGFLVELLRANQHLTGAVFDQPQMQPSVESEIAGAGLTARCRFVGGDFFDSVPSGADLYLLKHVLHDWEDAQAARLLRSIRRAMDERAVLLIVEALPAAANCTDALVKLRDLEQLFWTGGQVRSREQLAALLGAAGLVISHITATPVVDASLIYARVGDEAPDPTLQPPSPTAAS